MATQTANKTMWVIGILLVVVLFGGYKFWHDSQPTTTDNTSITNSGNNRHDNSGSGTQQTDQSNMNNHNPIQEIQKHLGL